MPRSSSSALFGYWNFFFSSIDVGIIHSQMVADQLLVPARFPRERKECLRNVKYFHYNDSASPPPVMITIMNLYKIII